MLAFAALLVAAGWLRTVNLNWDGYQHAHPDERFMVWVADTMRFAGDSASLLDPVRSAYNPFRWPEGVGEYAGQPRGYAYGHFPLYLLMLAGRGAAALATALPQLSLPAPLLGGIVLAEYEGLPLVGRVLSALFDLGTLVLLFVFARRLYGSPAGWLAAASYAVAVLPVQLSHFYTVDPPLTFFVLAAALLAARHAETGGRAAWVGAAAATGLAIGTKASAAMLLLPLFVAALLVDAAGQAA